MKNITYKNEKSIRKIINKPFIWADLTISNETGYHKIAIKKKLFKKEYTVTYIKNGKTEKENTTIDELNNGKIIIKGLGQFNIENINTSIKNPTETIEQEEKIYNNINEKARKEEIDKKQKEIKELKRKHEEEKRILENKKAKNTKEYYENNKHNKKITCSYKNENAINKILKQSFGWSDLTISNETGYYKIALKKKLFKNNYTITYIKDGKLQKEEIALAQIMTGKITIKGLGYFNIENVNTGIKNPTKTLEEKQNIYKTIEEKARKEELEKAQREIEQLKKEQAKEIEQIKIKIQKINTIKKINQLTNNLIETEFNSTKFISGFYETNKKIKDKGNIYKYKNETSNECYKVSYGMPFIIKGLEDFSNEKGYTGFENNKLNETLNMIRNRIDNLYNEFNEENINTIYTLHGLLAQELYIRTMDLCKYIREQRIDTEYKYCEEYATETKIYDNYHAYFKSETIEKFFDELITSVATYIERITGENFIYKFKDELETKALVLVR